MPVTVTKVVRLAIHPPPEVDKVDTSIRFTDILFGFVIKEIFVRLSNWELLPLYVQCHLLATSALVLGSWVGYRRSLNRSAYEVKFVNLPLVRFVIDQLMLVMYFRLAVITSSTVVSSPSDARITLAAADVTTRTLFDVLVVFMLYVMWDGINICMAGSKNGAGYRYPKIVGKVPVDPSGKNVQDWTGFLISLAFFAALGAMFCCANLASHPSVVMLFVTALLILYRVSKEIRTSYRHAQLAQET